MQRVCHVNLLKPYKPRDEKFFPRSVVSDSPQSLPVCFTSVNPDPDFGDAIFSLHDLKQTESMEVKLKHLSETQRIESKSLLHCSNDVFADTPGRTTLITHHINLREGSRSVAVAPYRLNPEKAAKVKQEIQEMLKLRITVPAESPWASPIMVVPKPERGNGVGALNRICTDYRRVNALSEAYRLSNCIPH
jgi:hypothetical protein